MRKYEGLWHRIRDASHNQWVIVKLSDWSNHQTVINMVQLEKSRARCARKGLDIPNFGRLVTVRDKENCCLKFRLEGAGHQL